MTIHPTRGFSRLAGVVCVALLSAAISSSQSCPTAPATDPTQGEVPLKCASGWEARLIFDAGVGVWTVACAQVQPQFGCPEVIALDDRGRCTVLRSYSGKWTPQPTIEDGQWFAPVASGELDPTLDGVELYTGGQGGRLWQIRPRPSAHFDCRVIDAWPGEEIHTLVLDDLDPGHEGAELLVFLASGQVYAVASGEGTSPGLQVREVARLPGRVRQAVMLPAERGQAPWVATVSRAGVIALVRLRGTELERRVIGEEPMGLGRVALSSEPDGKAVLYVSRDDGVILRWAGRPDSGFEREIVFAGPQGPRGVAVGRFHEDPRRECVAVFGYSCDVELLTRLSGEPWQRETIFTDVDKGHWLAVAELDGRNGTDELIGSGYGGRVFLLSRPPGYGLRDRGSAVASPAPTVVDEATRPLRVGLRARGGGAAKLTPLRYTGGFEPKTMLYETLVRRGDGGRIVPGLASSWTFEDEGRSVRFELRTGARFHDGTKVTAEAVRQHFRRWIGFPEHRWLGCNQRIVDVVVESERVFRVVMDRPWALLPDLCAINPCAIVGPGARDREGEFVRPVGTGPFRFVTELGAGRSWRVNRFGEAGAEGDPIDVEVFARDQPQQPIDALLRGDIDVFVGCWDEDLPAERLHGLRRDPSICIVEAPGSSVVSLSLRLTSGPTADLEVRRRIAAAISRDELVRRVEGGYADPCDAWAAPGVEVWPRAPNGEAAAEPPAEPNGPVATIALRIATGRGGRPARVAAVVAEQLGRAGFRVELVDERDAHDLAVAVSHGVPYDPHSTLSRLSSPGVSPELRSLVGEAQSTPDEQRRLPIYARIQALLDRELPLIPLYAPRRIALHRAGIGGVRLGIDVYQVDLTGLRRAP